MLKYRILAEIGQGGMSIVYRALDERLGRHVALKVLHTFLAKNAECRARLAREAKIAAQLQHPNILQVFDYSGEDANDKNGQELFIVTELVIGQTLREFADQHALKETPEIGALIIWEMALALQYAHSLGVIHRDIKPENMMVRNDGVLKLMDFGIAQVKNLSSLTITGTLLGSPAYMAPEVIEGKPSDHRSDIFSLSTVFYWLLTGQMPFNNESPHALLKAIVDGRFKPPEQVSSRVLDSFNQIVLKGMATLPEQRFNSAHEMALAIFQALENVGIRPDSHELKFLLANPHAQIPVFTAHFKETCLSQAKKFKEKDKPAQALSLLNRLIAQYPEDPQVLQLLSEYEHKKTVRHWSTVLIALFITTFLSLTIFMTNWFEDQKPLQQTFLNKDQASAISQMFAEITNAKPEPKATVQEKKSTPAEENKTVVVTIQPYADFYVNGKLIAENTSKSIIKLKPGSYTFLFKHQFAATEERTIEIRNKDKNPYFSISLNKTKPAVLIVSSDIDADIAVNGVYKGTTNASLARPILIALPDKTHALNSDIIISKPGYETIVLNARFIAGQIKELRVKLQPMEKKNDSKLTGN